jgi:hypothetical protein
MAEKKRNEVLALICCEKGDGVQVKHPVSLLSNELL